MTTSETRVPPWTEDRRFRTIFEQSPVSTQIFAPSGETLAVNPAWEKLWGVTLEQLGGYNILHDQQLVDKGIMPYILQGFAGTATDIPAIKYEPDKTIPDTGAVPYRWVRASIYPVRDERGTIREVVLMHEDITEQMRAEDALKESEARFRAMFYGAPVGISLIDQDGRYVAVNPARERMLGFSEQEMVGKSYLDFTHEEDIEYDMHVNARAREQNDRLFQLEKRFVRRDGSVEWARITAARVLDADGAPSYSISIAEDITAQKRAEAERAHLYELERQTRAHVERLAAERAAILGQIADGIIIGDMQGRITFVNAAAHAIHGVAELGVPIERYSEVYHLFTMDGQPYPPDELPLTRAIRRGETVLDAEWRIRRPDGVEVIAQGSASPVVADDGTRLGAVLIVRDVTAQHTLEEQKDQFLSAVAHDLRTPLTTIKGRAQMLQRRLDHSPGDIAQVREGLMRIDASAARMITLINELLDVANIQLGRALNLDVRPTDLVSLAADAVREHQQATDRHTISFLADMPELIGQWDGSRLERVLANLLSNAIKYSPRGGHIAVRVARERVHDAPWALLTIRDEGVGIPDDDLPHIFERFHRARNVQGKVPGTGIGLAAVREIVEQSGGSVSVDSREEDGTTFTVRLPLPSS